MEITVLRSMSHMLWNIGADRGLGSRGFCGMWNEIKKDPCGLLMLTEGGGGTKSQTFFKQPLPLSLFR